MFRSPQVSLWVCNHTLTCKHDKPSCITNGPNRLLPCQMILSEFVGKKLLSRTGFGIFVSCVHFFDIICLPQFEKVWSCCKPGVHLQSLPLIKLKLQTFRFFVLFKTTRGVFQVFCGSFTLSSCHSQVQPTFLQQPQSEKS